MGNRSITICSLPRKSKFPFQVSKLYFCWHVVRPVDIPTFVDDGLLELSLRLACSADKCMDEINGIPCAASFPHVLIKRPGVEIKSTQPEPRDTIAFHYPIATANELTRLGLLPQEDVKEFKMTPKIEELIKDFRRCLYSIYTPGAVDEIDWICFKLLRELFHTDLQDTPDEKTTIRNASIWMQVHYNEKLSTEDIARQYNMSRASFYRAWKRYFTITPLQYIVQLRLEAAARLLEQTPLAIAKIADEIGFGGVDAFYRKFQDVYNMTPAEYRKHAKEHLSGVNSIP